MYIEFGRRLRAARRRVALSQEEVARRVGLSRTSITNIERGRQRIPLHTLFLLASAVDCEAADLLPDHTGPTDGASLLEDMLEGLSDVDRDWVRGVVSSARAADEGRRGDGTT